jgi:integrase
VRVKGKPGRPPQRFAALVKDKAYDGEPLRAALRRLHIRPVIAHRHLLDRSYPARTRSFEKVDKQNVVACSNEHYGIPDRRFITNESKAKAVTRAELDKVRDEHVRMSLELQQAFGLRREEAMKFQPSFADRGEHIVLKASWTKGGKERIIPVRTEEQRDVLKRARRLAGFGSLIPSNHNYVHQLRVYEGNTLRAGLSHMHGLRHAYAQIRYEGLTGWKCPAASGPDSKSLTPEQRERDHEVRLVISRELGHEREAVMVAYLGR